MKSLRHIGLLWLSLLAQVLVAAPLTSADPYWIGGATSFGTTEGNDYWVTFMTNNEKVAEEPTLHFVIYAVANEAMTIIVEEGASGNQLGTITIPAGGGWGQLDQISANSAYLIPTESEQVLPRGLHIYTENKDVAFSCFALAEAGASAGTTRDATLLLPTDQLEKEYFVQTYPDDSEATEFVVVATEDGTNVVVTPKVQAFNGAAAGAPITITLNKGEVFMVRSVKKQGAVKNIDMSGSAICADKPVAVFQGNEATKVAGTGSTGSFSPNHAFEQTLPQRKWGTDFCFGLTAHSARNNFQVTAAEDGTVVTVNRGGTVTSVTLNARESFTTPYALVKNNTLSIKDVKITSTKPILCCTYLSCGGLNSETVYDPITFDEIGNYYWGNSTNAMVPAWNMRTTSMNFFTDTIENETEEGVQHMYVQVTTKTADAGTFTLDGVAVPSGSFVAMVADPTMSVANIELTQRGKHTISTTGDGFTGFVYTIQSESRAYQYTLGYNLNSDNDSLFVENTEAIMSKKSYDLERVDGKGWYQRQWNEWKVGHERLDTAQVCDSTIVQWMIQTPKSKQVTPVDWFIYDVTDGAFDQIETWTEPTPTDQVGDNNLYKKEYQFILPDESDKDPKERAPFREYEIRAILHRPHLICTDLDDDLDTMRTTVRVTRIYHDTVYRIICMGDTLKCFYDSLPHQRYNGLGPANELDNVTTTPKASRADSTLFIGDKTTGDKTEEFQWKAHKGENIFSRHYLTQYGCDSTYTLFLFVCDTFRKLDTLHLCSNERITYLGGTDLEKTYKGVEADGAGVLAKRDTIDIISTKTKFCECQLDPYKDKYPAFEGCDSIFELHLFVHPVYRDTLIDTMCYNCKPDSAYKWRIQYDTRDSLITKAHPNMQYDAGLRTWWGFFSDTLRTTTCPKCNEGKGCDSINVLKLYIPEPFYHDSIDSICAWDYDKENRKKIINVYRWNNHREGAAYVDLPVAGHYYDSCKTRYGCDSIYHLQLKYVEPFIDSTFHSMANNQTYTWHGVTYGPFTGPEFKDRDTDTTLYFYDANATVTSKGCDSIWRLDLRISDTYLFKDTRTICDIDSIHWRDSVILGAKWDGIAQSKDIRLTTDTTFVIYDSLKTATLPERDSVYQLTITQYPTFKFYDTLHVCDNKSVTWQDTIFAGYKSGLTTAEKTKVLPEGMTTADFVHWYPTNGPSCDSTYYLHLIIDPTYYWLEYDTVCQDTLNRIYTWTDHTNEIHQDVASNFVHWDSTTTKTCKNGCGCDSVYELRLTVLPTYYIVDIDTISEEETYYWNINNKTFGGTKATDPYDEQVPLGWTTVRVEELTNPVGMYRCDSVHELRLLVGEVYRDTLDTFTCATATSYEWKGIDKNGNEFVRKTITDLPASETHKYYYDSLKTVLNFDSIYVLHLYRAPSYIQEENGTVCQNKPFAWAGHDTVTISTAHAGDFDFYDYLETDSFKCDSTWILHLHVDTVYDELTDTAICQNEAFTWLRHEGSILWDKQTSAHTTAISTAHCGTYEFVDSLATAAGCDSVWTLRLRVDTVYTTSVEVTERYMCDKDTLHFYGEVIYGCKSPLLPSGETGIEVPDGDRSTSFDRDLTYITIHGCDSVVSHHFTVFKTYEQTKIDSVCRGSDYIWTDHTTRNLWDVRQQKWISASAIPTDIKCDVEYTYIDSIRTQNCPACNGSTGGCDSIWILKLRVDSVYDRTTEIKMSDEEWRQWEDTIYIGWKVKTDTISNTTLPRVVIPAGSIINHRDTTYETIHKCDSIERLLLKVGPTYRDTLRDTICDNEPYQWHHWDDPNPNHYARTDIEILKPGIYYDSLLTKEFGFDSIYVLLLENYPTYNTDTTDTVICQNSQFVWLRHEGRTIWDKKYNRHVSASDVPTNESDTLYYIDTLKTINGCDSIWTLRLYVPPTHNFNETATICASDTLRWQDMLLIGDEFDDYGGDISGVTGLDSSRVFAPGDYDIRIRRGTKDFDCDSVFNLHLRVLPIYRDTIERRACQSEGTYFYENLNNGAGGGGYIPAAHLSDAIVRNDTIAADNGCDSIITLHFFVDSVYNFGRYDTVCQAYGQEWIWYENGIAQDTISIDEGDKTFILGTHYKTIHGCDSIYGISVYVSPIYHFYDTLDLCENDSVSWHNVLYTGSQYTAYGKTYDATHYDEVIPDLPNGTYHKDLEFNTIHDCDSAYHLTLYVHEVAHTDSLDSVCQGHPFFNPNWNWGQGMYMNTERVGIYTSVDTIPSRVTGCDSIVTLTLRVDSVYDYSQQITVCQDTVNKWYNWIDDEGHDHGLIDISRARDLDSLEAHTTIHGCDSTYGIKLHIAPIYRFDSVYHICENERLVWQHRRFTGDSVVATPDDSIILKPGIYYDTIRYSTWEGCDSTFLVQVHVHPIFDTVSHLHTCYNETFIWHQTDKNGEYEDLVWTAATMDTIFVSSEEALLPYTVRPTESRTADRMLQTVHGCDSMSHLQLTIHPIYFFYTDTTICSNEVMRYRGKYFMSKDTTYTERLHTVDGCDSIYQLHLHIKPAFIYERRRSICDNETLIFPEDGRTVWQPGDRIPEMYDHIDFSYVTVEGCDSIYRYYVTVNKTYFFSDRATLCSNDSVLIQGEHYVGPHILFDVEHYYLPFDTVFVDSLKTVTCENCMNGVGCDSIYRLDVHVLPQYYHLDKDTICANQSVTWREHTYADLTPGFYSFKDSFQTKEFQCDSVYEFQLVVWSDYYDAVTDTICADETYEWQERLFRDIEPGTHFYYDSLTSIHGCDSVYHLYLTVLDTTFEVNYDTICYNDTLHVLDHLYTQPGDYKDTTLNAVGCHHFIYTHLAIIPPTVPTVWADSMCSQEQAFDLYYTYTSHDPVAFSLYYDSLGHAMGFEDMIDVPVTEYTNPMIITVPTPLRDNDRTKYPRPDNYAIHLVLDNGFCQRPMEDCFADTTFVMSYPAWLLEQRYGDVIALLNEQYNGGYQWTEYQWYQGDSMLVGQTLPYLYIPTGLDVGEQYHVRLTRNGEDEDFQTCPILVGANPIGDTYAPTMGYLAVTPTCVVTGHPYVHILSRKDGMYRITTTEGRFVKEDVFRADVTEVEVPSTEGMYIIQLWSNDTPEEPYRAIKILVRERCETCDTSF